MRNLKTYKIAVYALFIALLALITFTPIGYIPVGPIKATIIHLPVILMGLIFGKKDGLIAGALFGLSSMLASTFTPGILSFCFSPFVSVAGIGGNWMSLLIAFVPRMLFGFLGGVIGDLDCGKVKRAIMVVCNTLLHSVNVLGLIYICFKDAYASALGMNINGVLIALLTTFCTQSVVEAILAFLFTVMIYPLVVKVKQKIK